VNAELRREVLLTMGIEPMVLRSRAKPIIKPAVASVPAQPTEVSMPAVVVPKITLDEPTSTPAPPVKSPQPVAEAWPVMHFAVIQASDLLVVAQLPSWAQGMIEANCGGFFKDLSVYLPSAGAAEEVLGLPKQVSPSAQDYQGLLKGRLMRASMQGVSRLLLLSDHDELLDAVPKEWALYRSPGLNKIMDQAEHKQALWATLQTLSR